MSLILCSVQPQQALLATDSLARAADGREGHVAKMVPLVHINAVLAFRGTMLLQQALSCACFVAHSVDELVAHMHEAIPLCIAGAKHSLAQAGVADPWVDEVSEFVLVGWSEQREQVIGRRWYQEKPGGPFNAERIGSVFLGPWHESLQKLPAPSSPAAMAVVARAQRDLLNEKAEPRHRAGGKLICAEVTRLRTTVEAVCEL